MKAFPVRIGVDELSTGSDALAGFSFFCVPDVFVAKFEEEARGILKKTKMETFHAKDYKRRFEPEYKEFVRLIAHYVKKSPQALVACRLFSEACRNELAQFCNRLVSESIGKAIAPRNPAVELLQPYFFPLACLAALSRTLAPNVLVRIEMDSHQALKELNQVVHEALGVKINASTLLKGLYNGYAKGLHERTPLLPDDGVAVRDDESSMLVQAADVIGNFAMAHVKARMGQGGNATKAKSQILTDVLGDDVGAFDPAGRMEIEDGVLALVDEGGFTFRMDWVITKGPDDPKLMEDWPDDDGFLGKNKASDAND